MASSPFSWSGEFVIKKPWVDVMRAAQLKYPNPFNPNILSVDVISRNIDSETGVLNSVKLFNSSWPMVASAGELRAIERTVVDPKRKYMLLESNNIDMRGVLKAHERLEYEVHPENPEWTVIRQNVSVDAFRFIAYAALSASQKAAVLGREALTWAIENRVDNFMARVSNVPDRSVAKEQTASELVVNDRGSTIRSPLSSHRSFSTSSYSGFLGRLRSSLQSFNAPPISLPRPMVALADTPSVTDDSSTLGGRRRTSSISSLPASLQRAVSSFDTFNPVEVVGELREKVVTDVNVLRERLQRRCQRVADRFSRIDEYVLIM